MRLVHLIWASVCVVSAVSCANILAVVPTLSSSHYAVFEVVIKELARRGHVVTTITTFPQKEPVENLQEMSVKSVRKHVKYTVDYFKTIPQGFVEVLPDFFGYISDTETVLNATNVLKLISSEEKFDLIIYEMFVDDAYLGFAHKFKAPVIAMSTCYMFPWVADTFAIPANPSYVPGFYSHMSQSMNLYGRLQNFFLGVACRLFNNYMLQPKLNEIVRTYFGKDVPPVSELVKNVSLYFTNTHFTLFGAQPYPPQVVDVSGIHLKVAKPLPQVLSRSSINLPS